MTLHLSDISYGLGRLLCIPVCRLAVTAATIRGALIFLPFLAQWCVTTYENSSEGRRIRCIWNVARGANQLNDWGTCSADNEFPSGLYPDQDPVHARFRGRYTDASCSHRCKLQSTSNACRWDSKTLDTLHSCGCLAGVGDKIIVKK